MIEQIVSEILRRVGITWTLDTGFIQPDEKDVRQMLDEAAKRLYDGRTGDRFTSGGLIIEKTEDGHDVYVYVGNYK